MANYNPHKGWIRRDGSALFGAHEISHQENLDNDQQKKSSRCDSFYNPDTINSQPDKLLIKVCRFIDELKHDDNDDVHEKKIKIDFAKRLLDTTHQQQQDEERVLQSKQSGMERKIDFQLQAKSHEELKLKWMPKDIETMKEKIENMKKDKCQLRSDVAPFEEALEHYEQTERLFRMELRNINIKLEKLREKLRNIQQGMKQVQDSKATTTRLIQTIENYKV